MSEWKDSHDQYLDEWVSFPYEIKRYQEWLPVYTPFPDPGDVLAQEMFDAIEGKIADLEEYLARIIYHLGELQKQLNAIEYYMTKAADQMEIYLDSTKVLEIEQIHGVTASLVIGSDYNDLININTANLTDWQIVGDSSPEWVGGTAAAAHYWYCICWSPELSLFVAVSYSQSSIMTSPDGINWTMQSSPVAYWMGCCWSSDLGLFVAVGLIGSHRVATSPDGINWTPRVAAGDRYWGSVCWSPELSLFVAAAYSGLDNSVMTSPDGINWTIHSTPYVSSYQWRSICWSPELNLFVVVARNKAMSSPDGINWTIRAAPTTHWMSVCWSPEQSIFVAVSGISSTAMTSSDGINWASQGMIGITKYWNSVCWSPESNLFVAVATVSGSIITGGVATSPDGIAWTLVDIDPALIINGWNSICWSPELSAFVAVANYGAIRVMSLTDGGVSVLYEYEGIGWDNDPIIIKYIADWDFGKDYLIHPLITFDGDYGIYPNIDIFTKAKTTIEGTKDKITNSEDVLEDYK